MEINNRGGTGQSRVKLSKEIHNQNQRFHVFLLLENIYIIKLQIHSSLQLRRNFYSELPPT